MTDEVRRLCIDILWLYQYKSPLPEEFDIQLFEWGMERYAMGEKYCTVRRLCDEIMNGDYDGSAGDGEQTDRLMEVFLETRYGK